MATPYHLLLLLLLVLVPLASSSADREFLLALKEAVTNDPAAVLSAWSSSSSSDHCHWRGVTCHPSSSAVAAIDLPAASLSGALPAVLPPHLLRLDLSLNNFSGPVPAAFLASPTLRALNLSSNRLSGPLTFPPSNSSPPCPALAHLRLAANFLVGQIPAAVAQCRALRVLDLSRNVLEGAVPRALGRLAALRVLHVSRNSLTDRIPHELAGCRDLAVLVLTDPAASASPGDQPEFNAFVGLLPPEVATIPTLQVLWAPRANLDGRLPRYRNSSCSLRAVNLGQNYIAGPVPPWLVECGDLTFLDLSSNSLEGSMPAELNIGCMEYLNVSWNLLSGPFLSSMDSMCSSRLIDDDVVVYHYYQGLVGNVLIGNPFGSMLGDITRAAVHDFSNNGFAGALPSVDLHLGENYSYGLLLNSNTFNGTLSGGFFGFCKGASGIAVNLSSNQLSGSLDMVSSCTALQAFEAGENKFSGSISHSIGDLHLLRSLILSGNNLTGEIAGRFANLAALEVLMLDHNRLSGTIPPSFS
ncbi:hypothetical protein ACQ4PT_033167 [Festuca glaucescens]